MRKVSVLSSGKFINKIYSNSTRKELEDINIRLTSVRSQGKPFRVIKDPALKRRIAMICLEMMENNASKKEMFSTAYDLSIFYGFEYRDELDEVFQSIYSITLGGAYDNPLIFVKWKKIQKKLHEYLLA